MLATCWFIGKKKQVDFFLLKKRMRIDHAYSYRYHQQDFCVFCTHITCRCGIWKRIRLVAHPPQCRYCLWVPDNYRDNLANKNKQVIFGIRIEARSPFHTTRKWTREKENDFWAVTSNHGIVSLSTQLIQPLVGHTCPQALFLPWHVGVHFFFISNLRNFPPNTLASPYLA